MSRLIDVSHEVADGLITYPGLPTSGFRFHAVPVKFRGVGTFPVRAYGVLADTD